MSQPSKSTADFYRSSAWLTLRSRALRLAGWRCAWCGADVRGRGCSRVDHIRPRRDAPELALDLRNLRVLCPSCDNRRHHEKGGKQMTGAHADGTPRDPAHHWHRR
jgi:5-methylcytosine-specific restriction endonuclease McrA